MTGGRVDMTLMNVLRKMFCRPCRVVDVSSHEVASAEKMKYEKNGKNTEISQESHALGNAVTQMQGTAKDIRMRADALTRLARGL